MPTWTTWPLFCASRRAASRSYPFHIGIPAAYLLLTEMEIQDLTLLLEAKSAHLPPERFQPHLLLGWASEQR
jgi:vacuolar-type H+-ATPase subunit C/Vma6